MRQEGESRKLISTSRVEEPESYSHKFNHLTPLDMIEYLTKRGAVDTETPLTPFEIQQKYFRYINKRLKGLEEDMGIVY